jgi:hypothetical protein
MRITLQTEDEIRLDEMPWFPAVIPLVFLVIILAGIVVSALRGDWSNAFVLLLWALLPVGFFLAFARRSQFHADRRVGQAVLRLHDVRGRRETLMPLAEILGARAEVRQSRSRNNRHVSSRPVLLLAKGEHLPLTTLGTIGTGAETVAATLNAWLARGRP